MEGRRKLQIDIDIYGLDEDVDPQAVAQALGFTIGEAIGFDGLDGYDRDDELTFDTMDARWIG